MPTKVLIVDNDKEIQKSLTQVLRGRYRVLNVTTGKEALQVLKEKEIDLLILEIRLPDMSGVEVMRQVDLSYPETRVVILTEERSFEAAVAAVRGGAVDYLLKPYEREKLVSSVRRALVDKAARDQKKTLYRQVESSLKKLREVDGIETPEIPPRRVVAVAEGVMVDLDRREMWRNEERVELTPNEGLLLITFLENRGRVMTHQELVMEVKGEGVVEDRAPETLRPMVSRLRKKITKFSGGREWIKNIRGRGYVFDAGK